ncbi:MAG: exported protein of unknown function [Promethearchaeota archaeon]|nr:MAG: exported protein of unknown function [Candidatus Lokiarchaeota archaeon]
MKSKNSVVIFMLFCLVSFSTAALGASDYSYGVSEDELFIYEIKSYDEDLAEDAFVNPDIEDALGQGAEVGAMTATMITDIDDIDDYNNDATEDDPGWQIEGWYWNTEWTEDEEDFDDPDSSDIWEFTIKVPEDPEDYGAMLPGWEIFLVWSFIYTGVPDPADEYLDDIEWADIDVEDSTLVIEGDASTNPTINEDVTFEYEFKSNGQFHSRRILSEDDEVIYEVSLQSFLSSIPGYNPTLIGGLMVFSIMSLIYLNIIKKQEN